ncbi:serine hydrolase [Pantoea sp. 1.19]|uniref:serine hydrolase domain-containing protein n=1 Tax=Pantoea sp. 1.19 TaxID=1925589 RepID=UPI000AD9BC49|nr:serine hydrolase [Pantoea sp. 1.19]
MKKRCVYALLFFLSSGCASALADADACRVDGLMQAPQPCDRHLPPTGSLLSWSPSQQLIGFRNDYRQYPGDRFSHGSVVKALPPAAAPLPDIRYHWRGKIRHLDDYLRAQNVQGMLILHDGKIVLERYLHGNTATTLWTSRSVGKSVVSTLVGIALKQGKIASLDDPITRYEPDFIGTAWDGVTLKQLITHTSGVAWNEDYTDPHGDFAALTQCETRPDAYACVRQLVRNVRRLPGVAPGQRWSYNTGGAWLLGDILERATGQPLARWLQQTIWQPYGMARDGIWHAYQPGVHDMGGHGFNATLRDWGRFGQYILDGGQLADGRETLPPHWLDDATRWSHAQGSVSADYPEGRYGYQWWNNRVPATWHGDSASEQRGTSALWALGIYGQVIAIDRQAKVVMVQWSTWPQAEPAADRQPLESALFFQALTAALSAD